MGRLFVMLIIVFLPQGGFSEFNGSEEIRESKVSGCSNCEPDPNGCYVPRGRCSGGTAQ